MRAAANAQLVGVCDPDPAARAEAEWLPGVRAHADLAALLAQPGIDAVYVATPNHLHRPLVEAVAVAGKHVLCEKPMAGSLTDAEAMAAACRRAGVPPPSTSASTPRTAAPARWSPRVPSAP
jgi:predicted dehydrogenase